MKPLGLTSTALALTLFTGSSALAAGMSVDPKPFNSSDVDVYQSEVFVVESTDFAELQSYYNSLFKSYGWENVGNFVFYPETGYMEFLATHPDGDVYDVTVNPSSGAVQNILKSKFRVRGPEVS